jgi:hypothetical protein
MYILYKKLHLYFLFNKKDDFHFTLETNNSIIFNRLLIMLILIFPVFLVILKEISNQLLKFYKAKDYEQFAFYFLKNYKTVVVILLIFFWTSKFIINNDSLFMLTFITSYVLFLELLCSLILKETILNYTSILISIIFFYPPLLLFGKSKPFLLSMWDVIQAAVLSKQILSFAENMIRKYPKFSYSLIAAGAAGSATYGGATISDYFVYKELADNLALHYILDDQIGQAIQNRLNFAEFKTQQSEIYKTILINEAKLIFPKFKGHVCIFQDQINSLKAQHSATAFAHNKLMLDSVINELIYPENI